MDTFFCLIKLIQSLIEFKQVKRLNLQVELFLIFIYELFLIITQYLRC